LHKTPKTPRARSAHTALPTREELLAFLAGKPAPNGVLPPARVGKRDIARAFGIHGDEARTALKLLLKDLENEGEVRRGRKMLSRQGRLPAMVVADIVERDRDGDLIARPVEWNEEGEAPRIQVRLPKFKRDKAPAPGMGARVLMRVDFDPLATAKAPPYSGRVVKILDRAKTRMLGVYRELESGGGRALPIEKRALGREIFVPAGMAGEAREGDLVALELLREGRFGLPSARVVERLGSVDTERAVSMIALAAHGIPHVFSAATLREADEAKPATLAHREDWRTLPLVTIDPSDAKDHDDAVHAEPDTDPANANGFVLTVAIADVAYYVRPGSPLDREALERGNSVYFPDRVVPMLPERISNDLCSLRENEDRPALAVRMVVGADGRKRRHKFHRIFMRSAAKLSYPQAQAAIDGSPDETTGPLLEPVLRPLWDAYAALKKERDQREPLDLDLPERKLILDKDGKLDRVIWPERLDAHRLIEEFMILANVAAAETLESQLSPLIYRAHDAPSMAKLSELGEFLATLGVKLAKGETMRRAVAGGIHPRELRALRPQPAALRAFHLADPPLRRSDRASRAYPRPQFRPRRVGGSGAALARRRRRAHLRRRAARHGGGARDFGPADRRASGLSRRRVVQGAHRRGHQVRAVRQARRHRRRRLHPRRHLGYRLFPLRRGAPLVGGNPHRRDVPARRPGRSEARRGRAVRWRAALRDAVPWGARGAWQGAGTQEGSRLLMTDKRVNDCAAPLPFSRLREKVARSAG